MANINKPKPDWRRNNVQPKGELGPVPRKKGRAMNDDTTRPEPAADAVEAAAEAIRSTADAFFSGREVEQITSVKSAKQAFDRLYRQQARAALQAAAVEPGLSLDAVEWEEVHISKSDVGSGVVVEIDVPDSRYRRVVIGSGATVEAALASAVRHAKEEGR